MLCHTFLQPTVHEWRVHLSPDHILICEVFLVSKVGGNARLYLAHYSNMQDDKMQYSTCQYILEYNLEWLIVPLKRTINGAKGSNENYPCQPIGANVCSWQPLLPIASLHQWSIQLIICKCTSFICICNNLFFWCYWPSTNVARHD